MSRPRKFLTEEEIQEYLQDYDSDEDSNCSDDSVQDPDWGCPESSDDENILLNPSETINQRLIECDSISISSEVQNSQEPEQSTIVISENDIPNITSSQMQHDYFKQIIWEKGH